MVSHGRVERFRRGLFKWMVRLTPLRLLGGRKHSLKLVALGQGDGSWTVADGLLGDSSVCYCFGIGCDASFDVALVERYACKVFSFDPTPSSIEYMGQHADWPLTFSPWGVWSSDMKMPLYRQDVADDTNLSVIDSGTSRGGKQAEVEFCSLPTIMQRLGHQNITLLKMDIEGAWFEVLGNMLLHSIVPEALCVEFDSPTSLLRVLTTIKNLRQAGLVCIHRDRDDYLFVRETALEKQ